MYRALFTLFTCIFLVGAYGQEICDNGIDDDGDMLIDLNDTTDCSCGALFLNGGQGVTSIIPNPSFESFNCCPSSFSQLNCADLWEQATSATSDFFHSCGYTAAAASPYPLPAGNGLGCVGALFLSDYQEYVGANLLTPMLANTSYTLQFDVYGTETDGFFSSITPPVYPPVDITIFGLNTPAVFPIGTTACPVANGWTNLGAVSYTLDPTWQTIQLTFTTPNFDVPAIMFGPPCVMPAGYPSNGSSVYTYVFFDGLTLNQSSLFVNSNITADGTWCNNDMVLTAHVDTALGNYQWFYDGIALNGMTDTILPLSANSFTPGDYAFMQTVAMDSCATNLITVPPPVYPVPDLSANVTAGCSPLAVNFTNLTDTLLIGAVTSIWDFGNGMTASTFNTNTTYTLPGLYDVSLTITSADGCISDTIFADLIEVYPDPSVQFSSNITEGCEPLTVNFTNDTDPAMTGICAWDLGNGVMTPVCDPFTTYASAGTYDVSLTVTSPNGCTADSTITQMITVHQTPIPQLSAVPASGCVPLTSTFQNTTANVTVASCAWDMGDGTTFTGCNPVHTYDSVGVYDVSLAVVSDDGCVADTVYSAYISVYGYPEVELSALPLEGCYPLNVDFQNGTSAAQIGTAQWTFGDGGSSSSVNPQHTYAYAGLFDVFLSVTSPENCTSDTLVPEMITVYEHPIAGFVHDPNITDLYDPIYSFFDSSSTDVVAWNWSFDGPGMYTTSSIADPVVTFPAEGPVDFTVMQVVTNYNGCLDTLIKTVTILGTFNTFVPNAFTPDGDGVNDLLLPVIEGHDPDAYEFRIFDRWGQEIFYSTTMFETWDGTFGGSQAKQDVYVWKLSSRRMQDGVNQSYMGHVTLIR